MAELVVIACIAFDRRASAERLLAFKECILNCPQIERAMEVCGTFDLIVQGRCADVGDFTKNMERLRDPLSEFVLRVETNFVARMMDRSLPSGESAALWVPCKNGRRRIECRQIDKVVAEGDYMRIHIGEWSCLLHETMAQLSRKLVPQGFAKLHRSWLVRTDFIERLIHEEGRWIARLIDGSEVSVAKSHVQDALRVVAGESSSDGAGSAILSTAGEATGTANEIAMTLRS